MPTTILGAAPHATTTDDRYKGFLIPKGAGVVLLHLLEHRRERGALFFRGVSLQDFDFGFRHLFLNSSVLLGYLGHDLAL